MFRLPMKAGASVLVLGFQLIAGSAVADPAQVQQGQTLYAAQCAACHGNTGQGGIGPSIVGKTTADLDAAIARVAMMASLSSLTAAERAAIGAYLQSL